MIENSSLEEHNKRVKENGSCPGCSIEVTPPESSKKSESHPGVYEVEKTMQMLKTNLSLLCICPQHELKKHACPCSLERSTFADNDYYWKKLLDERDTQIEALKKDSIAKSEIYSMGVKKLLDRDEVEKEQGKMIDELVKELVEHPPHCPGIITLIIRARKMRGGK